MWCSAKKYVKTGVEDNENARKKNSYFAQSTVNNPIVGNETNSISLRNEPHSSSEMLNYIEVRQC